jgi:outer membrane lipoprotein-sorting protein
VEDIKQYRAGNTTARNGREPIKSDAIAAPERGSSSRLLGGESGPVAINDGQTVDNSGSLPAVDEVVNKMVQATGGAAALNAVTSLVVKGTLDVVGISRGGNFEIYTVAPNKSFALIQPGPTETVRVGYNGQIGWIQTPTGVRLLKGAELGALKNASEFSVLLNLKSSYAKLTLSGKSKIGYREVYVIDMQPASGPADRLFVDAETYLPVRMNTVRMHRGAPGSLEIYYDDWREVDGLKLPYVITESFQKRTMTYNVREIKSNVPVDAKLFEKPL